MTDIDIKTEMLVLVMDLIQMESHAHFTYLITKDEKWIERQFFASKLRKKYMELIEKELPGQTHCYNKHTLSAFYRAWECGCKYLRNGDKIKSKECFDDSGELLDEFININWSEELTGHIKNSFLEKIKGGEYNKIFHGNPLSKNK